MCVLGKFPSLFSLPNKESGDIKALLLLYSLVIASLEEIGVISLLGVHI